MVTIKKGDWVLYPYNTYGEYIQVTKTEKQGVFFSSFNPYTKHYMDLVSKTIKEKIPAPKFKIGDFVIYDGKTYKVNAYSYIPKQTPLSNKLSLTKGIKYNLADTKGSLLFISEKEIQPSSMRGLFDSKEDIARRKYFAKYYLEENDVINDMENIIDLALGKGTYEEWAAKYGFDAYDVADPNQIYKIIESDHPKLLQKLSERGEKVYKERWGADGWSEQLKKLRTKGLSGTSTRKNMATKKKPKKSDTRLWMGIPNIRLIWHGEWGDPEIAYNRKTYNAGEIEDYFYEEYNYQVGEAMLKNEPIEDNFKAWMKKHAKEVKEYLKNYYKSNDMNGVTPDGYNNVSKADIAKDMAEKFPKLSASTIKDLIDAYWDTITKKLKSGKSAYIRINNIGSFKVVKRSYNKIVPKGKGKGKNKKFTTTKATTKKIKFEPSKNFESLVIDGKDTRKPRTGRKKSTKKTSKNKSTTKAKNTAKGTAKGKGGAATIAKNKKNK